MRFCNLCQRKKPNCKCLTMENKCCILRVSYRTNS